jgi:hypothetical protein
MDGRTGRDGSIYLDIRHGGRGYRSLVTNATWNEDTHGTRETKIRLLCLRMSNMRETRLGSCKRVSNKRQGMIQKYILVSA